MKTYYTMSASDTATDITIYGDITSFPWFEGDVSAYLLSKQIDGITTGEINVYINSYGGELAEGLAIYTALKRHKARVTTYCDGFACSAASVIFMAGDKRVMGSASLLMIHNVLSFAYGNANDLRKTADDLEQMSEVAANAYRDNVNIDDAQLKSMMDAETWISPQDAVTMGFATKIDEEPQNETPAANVKNKVVARLSGKDKFHIPTAREMRENEERFKRDVDELIRETAEAMAGAIYHECNTHIEERLKEREQNQKNTRTFLDALMRKKGNY